MPESVEELFRLYDRELYCYLKGMGAPEHAVDDMIQDTFLEAFKSIESFRGESSAKTWLFAIARRQLSRWRRKHKPGQSEPIPEGCCARGGSPEEQALLREVADRLEQTPPPAGEIMRLRLFAGLPFSEIAQRIGKSETYCRVSFHRALLKLRKEYQE